jgi:hypothetical protein
MTRYRVLLNSAPVTFKSATQKRAAQSVCEAELYKAFVCAQEMLYVNKNDTGLLTAFTFKHYKKAPHILE